MKLSIKRFRNFDACNQELANRALRLNTAKLDSLKQALKDILAHLSKLRAYQKPHPSRSDRMQKLQDKAYRLLVEMSGPQAKLDKLSKKLQLT